MPDQTTKEDIKQDILEDERRHLPEGETLPEPVVRRNAALLMVLGVFGMIAVGVCAYLIDGFTAMILALVLVVVYVMVGAMPAWIASYQRSKREESLEREIEKRLEGDSNGGSG